MSVWCRVRIRDLSRLVSWWVAALCLAILRPLRKLWLHVKGPEEVFSMVTHILGSFEF